MIFNILSNSNNTNKVFSKNNCPSGCWLRVKEIFERQSVVFDKELLSKFERFDEKERTIFQLGMALDNGKSDCIIDINETTDKLETIYPTGKNCFS